MNSRLKILIGLGISIFIVICVNFLFNKTEEFFEYGYEFGQVFSNLSLAYIGSYIFYRIVVVEREKEVRKTMNIPIAKITKQLLFNGFYVIDVLAKDEKKDRDKLHKRRSSITKTEFLELCNQTNPNSKSRFTEQVGQLELKSTSKIEYLTRCIKIIKEHLNNLNTFLPYLSPKNQELLDNLSKSNLIQMGETLFFLKTNTNFGLIGDKMYEFLNMILELEELYNKEIKDFS